MDVYLTELVVNVHHPYISPLLSLSLPSLSLSLSVCVVWMDYKLLNTIWWWWWWTSLSLSFSFSQRNTIGFLQGVSKDNNEELKSQNSKTFVFVHMRDIIRMEQKEAKKAEAKNKKRKGAGKQQQQQQQQQPSKKFGKRRRR